MNGELGRVKEIIKQEGDNVLLSVPVVGVPKGFQFRSGDKVALFIDENGNAVARPLVHVKRADSLPESGANLLEAEGQKLAIQENTIVENVDEQSEELEVFIVDNDSEQEQVIAVRSRN